MNRTVPLLALSLAACSHNPPTAEECKALADPKAVIQRCTDGNLSPSAKYVGDLKCWPFSKSERLRGLWVIDLEASAFYPNANTVPPLDFRHPPTWLETDLIDRRPELLAAAQGAGRRVYAVEFQGRKALCDGPFGHMGVFPREVIVERFYSLRPLHAS